VKHQRKQPAGTVIQQLQWQVLLPS